MLRVRFFFPLLVVLAALAAACGGGGTSPVPPAPTPTPHAGPTTVPVGPTPQAVSLTGGGYTLAFDVPPVVTGTTATMNAVLQTSLPSGTSAPQEAKRQIAAARPLSTTYSGLVYLVISTTDTVGFSSAPSFQYTLPAGTTVPTGSYAYLLYWDPYVSGSTGWIPLLGPGAVSGQTVTFPSVQTGVQFNADTQYIFALAVTTHPQPTASPAPIPTPTINPSASPSALPAYCASYSTPQPNANAISSPQPVYFTDKSGTGAQVYFYVLEGADAGGQTRYLGTDGNVHPFISNATAPPFPLECFPGSTHNGNGKTFELPPPPSTGYGANLYIAYATPMPGDSAPPNPLQFTGSGTGYSGPSLQPGSSYASAPFEFVEYQLPHATLDVTQVDKVGLPIQVTQNSPTYGNVTIGFTSSAQYQNLLNGILADPVYKSLAVSTVLNGRSVLARILAPKDGYDSGFPQDWWYNSTYNSAYPASNQGYVQYLLSQYKQSPQLYTLNGVPGMSGYYCASSDGSSNVLFYPVTISQPPCPTAFSGSPAYTLNAAEAFEGDTLVGNNVCQSILFAMPWGSAAASGGVLTDQNEFFLWKAMVLDINRGFALNNSVTHPYPTWSTGTPPPLPNSSYYPSGTMYNTYAKLVHQYMNNNEAYAIPYDEPGGLAPTTTSDPSVPLQITIWNIPSYNGPAPATTPSPSPACPPSM
jgi:hypothetical protein